jgi:hypothetical protein
MALPFARVTHPSAKAPRVTHVTGDPLGTPALEQRSFYLRHPGIDVIHLRPFPRSRIELSLVGGILALVSIGLPGAYLINGGMGDGPPGRTGELGAIVVALLGAGIGSVLLLSGVRGSFSGDVVFNRPGRTINGRYWSGRRWHRGLALHFDDVESLQVCSRQVIGDDPPRVLYVAYELNLVLSDDAATRVGLASHGDEAALMADADTLAGLLGRGVIDDRGGEIPGLLRNPRMPRP